MIRIYVILILTIFLIGCDKEKAPDCFQSAGTEITKEIVLDQPFSAIEIYDNIQLTLLNSTEEHSRINITGGKNLLPEVVFEIEDQTLIIRNENTCNWVRKYDEFAIEIFSNDINHLFNWGSGGVDIISYSNDSLIFEQEASLADNKIDFSGNQLTVNMHGGSGSIRILGEANHGQFYCNGVAFLTAKEFMVNSISANNSGDNDMFISPENSLFAYIGGTGNIFYNKDSITLTSSIEGNGELIFTEF